MLVLLEGSPSIKVCLEVYSEQLSFCLASSGDDFSLVQISASFTLNIYVQICLHFAKFVNPTFSTIGSFLDGHSWV